jgi:hypothetical protein
MAQDNEGFQFHRPNKKRYKINFVNYNNLIIIKVRLNGRPMNFLLDTGVDNTILFGVEGNEEEIKKASKRILIKGVSGKKKAYAYKNENNVLEIGKLKDSFHDVYAIFDKSFNISDKIGYQVQGIIGYDFFKNHIVKIDYIRNHVKVYNPKYFNKSLRNYDTLDIRLFEQKPYIKTELKQDKKFDDFLFLLDTGSGDALWVMRQANQELPEKSFDDILGYGFADIILGTRSKAKAFKLGNNIIENPKIAFPDTLSYEGLEFTNKSGVIGSEVMRRYHWVLDYAGRKVYIKPNSDISDDFNYDMSGLILIYDGYQAVEQYQRIFNNIQVEPGESKGFNRADNQALSMKIEMRPILKVGAVRPNSSAFEAGFIEDDEIIRINGKESYRFDLQEISKLLSSKEGLEIDFKIKRNGSVYDKSLILKSRFLE